MIKAYYNTIIVVERMHRLFLDVLKNDINRLRVRDINNVQALIIYNIADKELTVGALTDQGYYQGSNVTYNLRKMVENGYVIQLPDPDDRRVSNIKLSKKGLNMYEKIGEIFEEHYNKLHRNGIDDEKLVNLNNTFDAIERYLVKI